MESKDESKHSRVKRSVNEEESKGYKKEAGSELEKNQECVFWKPSEGSV